MKTLTMAIDATTRKAVVQIDDGAKVICALKKEGNGTYSVVLKDKVTWPTKFVNVGQLKTQVVTRREDEVRVRNVATNPTAITTVNQSKRLQSVLDATRDKLDEDEIATFEAVILRIGRDDELDAIERKIIELNAKKTELAAAKPADDDASESTNDDALSDDTVA